MNDSGPSWTSRSPVSYVEKVEKIPGVISVTPRLWGYYYQQPSRTNYTLMVPEDFTLPEDEIGILKGLGWDTSDILMMKFWVDPYELAVLFFLIVVPYAFITVVPVWKVSVIDPDAVMKS